MNDIAEHEVSFTHKCPICAEPMKIGGYHPRHEKREGKNVEGYIQVQCHKCGNKVYPVKL